jgi:hypothetical protein
LGKETFDNIDLRGEERVGNTDFRGARESELATLISEGKERIANNDLRGER